MPPPFLVLKHYVPKIWDGKMIGTHLVGYGTSLGLKPLLDPFKGPVPSKIWHSLSWHAEVRRRTLAKPAAESWHQDGDLDAGCNMDHALLLWANRTPTEFKTPDGKIWQPAPFEVVLARNLACFHRRPANAPRRRWMFRQRVLVPLHLKELP
jgi:hypothetical protein